MIKVVKHKIVQKKKLNYYFIFRSLYVLNNFLKYIILFVVIFFSSNFCNCNDIFFKLVNQTKNNEKRKIKFCFLIVYLFIKKNAK
jgi:hypothetical protein